VERAVECTIRCFIGRVTCMSNNAACTKTRVPPPLERLVMCAFMLQKKPDTSSRLRKIPRSSVSGRVSIVDGYTLCWLQRKLVSLVQDRQSVFEKARLMVEHYQRRLEEFAYTSMLYDDCRGSIGCFNEISGSFAVYILYLLSGFLCIPFVIQVPASPTLNFFLFDCL
jgi:hypothetical protein